MFFEMVGNFETIKPKVSLGFWQTTSTVALASWQMKWDW
jgi:hypothetical protein